MTSERFSPARAHAGQAVLTTVLFLLFASGALLASFSSIALKETRSSRVDMRAKQSYFLAEAGLEDLAYRLRQGMQYQSEETVILDSTSATVMVSGPGNQKTIESRGDVAGAIRTSRILLTTGAGASFVYGLQVGYLGLDIENQAQVIGSVYSNGNIEADSGTRITGDAWVAGGTATTPDQAQESQSDDLLIRDIRERRDAAQQFVPSITAHARKASFLVKKVGAPGDATVRIVADQNGRPKNSGTLASGTLRSSQVTSTYGWVDVTFSSNAPLSQNQPYWVIIDNGSYSASRYYVLGGALDSSYSSGTFLYSPDWDSSSPVWTPPPQGSRDAAFRIFLGTVATEIDGGNVGQSGLGDAHANTIRDATISRDAYYQTIVNTTVGGASYPGSPDPPPQNFPLSQGQIDQFKADGDAGGSCGSAQGCDANGNYRLRSTQTGSLGPIRITGNLDVEDRAVLTLTGTIHVLGNVDIEDKSAVRLGPAYGAASGLIVADGTVELENQIQLSGSGQAGSYLMIITTSRQLSSPPAMRIKDAAVSAILYASEGAMKIENRASLKEAVAQKMELEDQAMVSYEQGLANVQFSSGPTGGWQIQGWNEVK